MTLLTLNVPTHLNGHPVIRAHHHSECATVMVDKGDELVVATWWPDLGKTWSQGHYSHGAHMQRDADADFMSVREINKNR